MTEEQLPPQEETKTPPTKEEIIAFFQEQIDVKKVQLELQQLNTSLAVARAEEVKALSFIGQVTNPKAPSDNYDGGVPHTITQEDLDNNPELVEAGIKVGDDVMIPAPEETKKERSLKKK